jgi:hypothetical protein
MMRAFVQGATGLALAAGLAHAEMPGSTDPASARSTALQRLREHLVTEQAEAQSLGRHLAAGGAIGREAAHDRTARAE